MGSRRVVEIGDRLANQHLLRSDGGRELHVRRQRVARNRRRLGIALESSPRQRVDVAGRRTDGSVDLRRMDHFRGGTRGRIGIGNSRGERRWRQRTGRWWSRVRPCSRRRHANERASLCGGAQTRSGASVEERFELSDGSERTRRLIAPRQQIFRTHLALSDPALELAQGGVHELATTHGANDPALWNGLGALWMDLELVPAVRALHRGPTVGDQRVVELVFGSTTTAADVHRNASVKRRKNLACRPPSGGLSGAPRP